MVAAWPGAMPARPSVKLSAATSTSRAVIRRCGAGREPSCHVSSENVPATGGVSEVSTGPDVRTGVTAGSGRAADVMSTEASTPGPALRARRPRTQ